MFADLSPRSTNYNKVIQRQKSSNNNNKVIILSSVIIIRRLSNRESQLPSQLRTTGLFPRGYLRIVTLEGLRGKKGEMRPGKGLKPYLNHALGEGGDGIQRRFVIYLARTVTFFFFW